METKETYFKKELDILKANLESKDDKLIIKDYVEVINKIIDIFGKQGHSGFSAPIYANVISDTIKKILLWEPLSPLTLKEDEFEEHEFSEDDFKIKQNTRLSSVMMEEDGKPYYLNAIVFKDEFGETFTGNIGEIESRQFIKAPFTPKTFYIDVVRKYNGYKVKDQNQLEEALSYFKNGI